MKQPCALCNWDDVETYTQWGVHPLPLFKNWAGSLERIQKTVDNFPCSANLMESQMETG